jgi:hypothetical protein
MCFNTLNKTFESRMDDVILLHKNARRSGSIIQHLSTYAAFAELVN